MRKITEQSARAFMQLDKLSSGNMTVVHNNGPQLDESQMFLHGNLIARAYDVDSETVHGESFKQRRIDLYDAGWQTVTTKERLNGLLDFFAPGCRVYQRDYRWYLSTPNGDYDWNYGATFLASGEHVHMIEPGNQFNHDERF